MEDMTGLSVSTAREGYSITSPSLLKEKFEPSFQLDTDFVFSRETNEGSGSIHFAYDGTNKIDLHEVDLDDVGMLSGFPFFCYILNEEQNLVPKRLSIGVHTGTRTQLSSLSLINILFLQLTLTPWVEAWLYTKGLHENLTKVRS